MHETLVTRTLEMPVIPPMFGVVGSIESHPLRLSQRAAAGTDGAIVVMPGVERLTLYHSEYECLSVDFNSLSPPSA